MSCSHRPGVRQDPDSFCALRRVSLLLMQHEMMSHCRSGLG